MTVWNFQEWDVTGFVISFPGSSTLEEIEPSLRRANWNEDIKVCHNILKVDIFFLLLLFLDARVTKPRLTSHLVGLSSYPPISPFIHSLSL